MKFTKCLFFVCIPLGCLLFVVFTNSFGNVIHDSNIPYTDFRPVQNEKVYILTIEERIKFINFERDLRCLVEAVYYESRGTHNKEAYLGVMDSIINRSNYKHLWSNTICGVIADKMQYSYRNNGKVNYNLYQPEDYQSYQEISKFVANKYYNYLIGEYTPSEVFYYYNPNKVKSKPSWVDNKYFLYEAGGHKHYSWHKNA